jgi:hypothetical protein
MFESTERTGRHWQLFLLHCALVTLLIPLVGLLNYWIAPIAGAFIGIVATRTLRDRSVIYAWLPALGLFALTASDPITMWDPSWSPMTHWQYFKNTMFGPDCGAQECLYTVSNAILTGAIGYSGAGYLVLRRSATSPQFDPEPR